ncbi:MAG: molybdopterin cofactor-binding domain-containing protein, partial [Pyrinomonadaceae bacterium]
MRMDLDRREFLKSGTVVGGGLLIGFYLPATNRLVKAAVPKTFAPNAFIRIGTDDMVTVIIHKAEMGQGVYTSLAMLVAEELEADWKKIRVESAPVDAAYAAPGINIQSTGGSSSISSSWERLRKAGAAGREMLIAAAAENWKVDPTSCRAEQGYVIHTSSRRRLSFGALADKASTMTPPKDVALKDPKDFKIIGKPTRRLDTAEKVNGKGLFGMDV